MTASNAPKELPWHLQGNYAPVTEEIDSVDLPVEGRVPEALEGGYFRNGMNPVSGWSSHWFFGSGMIHRIELGGGRALSYKNRYVRTPYFEKDMDLMAAMLDPAASPANTNIIRHAGRYLALEEAHRAWEVNADLETLGCFDFDGRFEGRQVTAHPKLCPETGELLFFGYSMLGAPYLTYYRADASGALVQAEDIELPRPVMMHDFSVTRNHAIFMDLPIVFSMETGPRYSPEFGARLGVLPRNGSAAEIQWYEVEPCTVFHALNAHEVGERIVLHVCRQGGLMQGGLDDLGGEPATLWRWTIDPRTKRVQEEQLDDHRCDFPRIDDRRVGLPARYGYAMTFLQSGSPMPGRTVLQYDLEAGSVREHDLGEGVTGQEPVFAPSGPDAAENEGWVLCLAHDNATNESSLVIIDAQDFSAPAVARIRLPQRVPFGAHGNWLPRV